MSDRMELRLTGSGGQGVILASVIFAEAAIIAGKYTAQSQSYGPEARGGASKAETLISDEPIGFTKVQNPTFLMALTQKSLDKYAVNLPEDCLVMIDDSLEKPANVPEDKLVIMPILRTAKDEVGRQQTANIVAVGCINELLHIVNRKEIEKAVMMHIPAGTETLNLKALNAGEKMAQEYLAASQSKTGSHAEAPDKVSAKKTSAGKVSSKKA